MEGALKQTELLHIKTDILWLRIMRYFNNFVFVSLKKCIYATGSVSSLASYPAYNRLQNLTAAVNATTSATRISLRGRELEPKANLFFFCTKNVQFRPRTEQTDAIQAYHRGGLGGRDSSRWDIFWFCSENISFNAILIISQVFEAM